MGGHRGTPLPYHRQSRWTRHEESSTQQTRRQRLTTTLRTQNKDHAERATRDSARGVLTLRDTSTGERRASSRHGDTSRAPETRATDPPPAPAQQKPGLGSRHSARLTRAQQLHLSA